MTYDERLEGLWYVLILKDYSWHIEEDIPLRVVIANNEGQEIHACTIESALRAALALYGGNT